MAEHAILAPIGSLYRKPKSQKKVCMVIRVGLGEAESSKLMILREVHGSGG